MKATIDTPLETIRAASILPMRRPVGLTRLIELPGECFAYTCPGSGSLRASPGALAEQGEQMHLWAFELGLDYPKLSHFNPTLGAELTVPEASSEGLIALAKWYTFLFAHDDLAVDHDEASAETLSADVEVYEGMLLGNLPPRELAIGAMLVDCVDHVRRLGPATEAFERSVSAYLRAGVEELSDRGGNQSIEDYHRQRNIAGAVESSFELAFVCMDLELPESWREHPAYRQIAAAAGRHICVANDLLSLPKELGFEGHQNFVALYREALEISSYRETYAEIAQHVLVPAALEMHAGFAELVTAAASGELGLGPGSSVAEAVALARRVGAMFITWVDGHLLWEEGSRRHRSSLEQAA